jgi:hypothetical protein
MKDRIQKIVVILLAVSTVFSVYSAYGLKTENISMTKEVEKINSEKLSSLVELEECLHQNEKLLKKELIERYADSMIRLRNKIEEGYTPDQEEIAGFFDRTEFIISNLGLIDLPQEKASQYVFFVESMRSLLKSLSEPQE